MSFPSNPQIRFEDYVERASENTDYNNWEWTSKSRAMWELAKEPWQEFRSRWYGAEPTATHCTSLADPNSPSLSLDPLHHIYFMDAPSTIFIRECYPPMFSNIWVRALVSEGNSGVIVTGQPGTGKSLFQLYVLARLLQQKQVVLFLSRSGKELYLFYHDAVHTIATESLTETDLPRRGNLDSRVFIWSLFDIPQRVEPNRLLVLPPCLPVQTTSPDPCRYKDWYKNRSPLFTALPLWTRDELAQGLSHQHLYPSRLKALESPTDPLLRFCGARGLLEAREGTKSTSPEDCLKYILDAAILRFGYAARDVFNAVFDFDFETLRHEHAFDLSFEALGTAVQSLVVNGTSKSEISHRILALTPVYSGPFSIARWSVNFKSAWVARSIVKKLAAAENVALRQQISYFQRIPQARQMVGWFLEPLALREITETDTGASWTLVNMFSNEADSPQFITARDTQVVAGIRFLQVRREVVEFQSIDNLWFENAKYYVPKVPNFPFLDAFTVDLDHSKRTALLWVLQMTGSLWHGGSAMGYQKIHLIMAALKRQLSQGLPLAKGKKVVVRVRYLLVVPRDGDSTNLKWQFPGGWNEACTLNDHRGSVYCLEIPLSVRFIIIKNILSWI